MRSFMQSSVAIPNASASNWLEPNLSGMPPMRVLNLNNGLPFDSFDPFANLKLQEAEVKQAVSEALTLKDFKALTDGLDFLKFDKETSEAILGVVSTATSAISVIGAVVSVVQTAQKVMELLGVAGTGDSSAAQLETIKKAVETHYKYTVERDHLERLNDVDERRNTAIRAQAAVKNVRISASPGAIGSLEGLCDELDKVLLDMLGFARESIPFSRQAYERPNNLWFSVGGSPYLVHRNGAPSAPLVEAKAIWDPAPYIDVLAFALQTRILVGTTLDPIYRSTGYRRPFVGDLARKLAVFVKRWEDSILVANPSACLLNDGTLPLYNHIGVGGWGILVGAVCPATGISSLQVFDGFPQVFTKKTGIGASGSLPDKFKAVNPSAALGDALIQHAILQEKLLKACGVRRFKAMVQWMEQAASPPDTTESVRLAAVATRGLNPQNFPFPMLPESLTLDLGPMRVWAVDSTKTYPAKRYYSIQEKVVTLRMARRGLNSGVRLGYKLRINGTVIPLTTWDTQPPPERLDDIDYFPSTPIQQSLSFETKVYDAIQTRRLTSREEESFDENADPGTADRLLLNERKRNAALQVRIEFQERADNLNSAYLGEVKIALQPLHPVDQPDSYLVEIDVLETHLGPEAQVVEGVEPVDPQPVEVVLEGLTAHVIPSYLVVGQDYFDAYNDAWRRMLTTQVELALSTRHIPGLEDVPRKPDPSPKFLTTNMAATIAINTTLFEHAQRDPAFAAKVKNYQVPQDAGEDVKSG